MKSPQWFRYDLDVDPERSNTLRCTFWGGDKNCLFDILIDGLQMTSQTSIGGKDTEFVEMKYEIPPQLLSGKKRVAVMFRSNENKPTAELYDCAILKTKE